MLNLSNVNGKNVRLDAKVLIRCRKENTSFRERINVNGAKSSAVRFAESLIHRSFSLIESEANYFQLFLMGAFHYSLRTCMRIISNLRSCSSLVIGSKSLVISTKIISLVLLEVFRAVFLCVY